MSLDEVKNKSLLEGIESSKHATKYDTTNLSEALQSIMNKNAVIKSKIQIQLKKATKMND